MLDDFSLLLVDDHPLFRDGLVAALHHQAPELRTYAVGTFAEALDALETSESAFDLVLLDYCMPDMDGLHCAKRLMSQYPEVSVGLMSGLADPRLMTRARDAGLSAYLPKSLEISVLLEHLHHLAQGIKVFSSPTFVTPVMDQEPNHSLDLTPRQLQVLHALASGGSNKKIAQILGIAPATVKKHLESIFARLGATNRLHAVTMAKSWLDEPPP